MTVFAQLLPFQLDAAEQTLQHLYRWKCAILADAVGSGKSFVALAVMEEFARSGKAATVVAPATLLGLWRGLIDRFELEAEVISHDALRHRPLMPGSWRNALVVVDEAHRFRNPATNRYDALARMVVGAFTLFVTATPFCNSIADPVALLRLALADDAFRSLGIASLQRAMESDDHRAIARAVGACSVWRRPDQLFEPGMVPSVRGETVLFDLPSCLPELEVHLSALRFLNVGGSAAELCRSFLRRQFSSSVAALRSSLRRQRRYALHVLQEGDKAFSKEAFFRLHGLDSAVLQQMMFRDFWSGSRQPAECDLLEEEVAHLDAMLELLHGSDEPKIELLERLLDEHPLPALLFTHSVETAKALHAALGRGRRTALVTAAVSIAGNARLDLAAVIDSFAQGKVEILIATDLASEGLNLQRAACVIHYDLPWNRTKLEQRTGRAARLGASHDCVESLIFKPREESYGRAAQIVERKARLEEQLYVDAAEGGREQPSHDPPHLLRGAPQVALHRLLDETSRLDLFLRLMLTRRYQAGVEVVLKELASERLDEVKIRFLRELLATGGQREV